MKVYVDVDGREHVVEIRRTSGGLEVLVDGTPHAADLAEVEGGDLHSLLLDGQSYAFAARFENGTAVLSFHDREVTVGIEDERTRLAKQATGRAGGGAGPSVITSVMPGVVKELRVGAEDVVEAGQALLILEAMKMENEIRAASAGRVAQVHVAAGDAVEKGAKLVTLAPPEAPVPTEGAQFP